jgi:hypothetical protein
LSKETKAQGIKKLNKNWTWNHWAVDNVQLRTYSLGCGSERSEIWTVRVTHVRTRYYRLCKHVLNLLGPVQPLCNRWREPSLCKRDVKHVIFM